MKFPRSSGILLHPTSLPSRFGIGDLGDEAYRFVDFLVGGGQSIWQMLPLGPTGFGDSPYQCFSAFAGNALLISPERLVEEELLSSRDLDSSPAFLATPIEFGRVIEFKNSLLRKTFENFNQTTDTGFRGSFEIFCQKEASWLNDYALFRAIKNARGGVPWNNWEPELARRDAKALALANERLRDAVEEQKFLQYLFFKQWSALKTFCHNHHIQIIGDVPIFVSYDSSDVWTNPHLFKLNEDLSPAVIAGVPPDYFSETGQLWGNPIYDWERMRADGFKWWIDRVRATLETVDVIRLDHFRGFAACWEVPGDHKTAEKGRWVQAPGRELLTAVKTALGDLPIIAEDLGVITPDVESLRDDFGLPGMRILQFAFGGDSRSIDLPHNYIRTCVAYTGTHDNDTTVGWFNSKTGTASTRTAEQIDRERDFCKKYLDTDGREIHWDFVRAVLASVANTAVIPLQDVLGLGTEARMNLPASTSGNWAWRFRKNALTQKLSGRLRGVTELYARIPWK